MLRWIVSTSLKYRYLVVAAAVALMAYGITRLGEMPVDVFPEFAPPLVEIQTEGPGMSTSEVESLITIQLEEALSSTPQLDVMRSKSVPGLSSIKLIFEPGTDPLHARQLVQERLAVALPSMPPSAGMPWMLQPLSATSRVMKIGLSSDVYDLKDLSMIAYWTITFRLMEVPGVANVAIWGERIKMLTVEVDPERLRAYDVSLDEVMEVTSEALEFGLIQYTPAAKTLTGGFIDTPNQRLGIQHVLTVNTPEELAKVTVYDRKKSDGTPLRLGDLGDVVWDTWPLIGDAVINDGPGIMLIVEKFPWGNTLEVTRGVEEAIEEMRPGLAGIEIDTAIFRPATFVELALDNLTEALLIGAGLVVLVIFAFLWEFRIALVSCVVIPVSMMVALLVLDMQGATINVMVLAGLVIAIGAVVDDAIVDVENVVRRFRQSRAEGSDKPTIDIVRDASLEVRNAIVYASLIEISALLPIFLMEGLSGSFFKPLATSYVVAGLVSPFVALTLTPALIMILLSRKVRKHRESPITPLLHRGYDGALAWTIGKPRLAYLIIVVLVIGGAMVTPFLGQELLPEFKERDFLMHWLAAPGTSHTEMYRITVQASRELRQIPGVRNFGAHLGRAIAADEVVGMYFTENWVSVDPSVPYDETVNAIQSTVDGYPGLVRDVQTYLKERIREVLTGSSHPIVIRIFGPELDVLRSKAAEVNQALSEIDGISENQVELQVDIPHIQIEVDLERAERYGIKPGDVRRAAATLIAGTEVSDIHLDNWVYDVFVWSTPETRQNVTNIRELLIDAPTGGHVRLADVADVLILPTPNSIERESQSRRIDVEANIRGRDLGSVVGDVERALEEIEFPLGYHAELLGEYAERQAAQQRLFIAAIAAGIAIFFLLLQSVKKWRLAIMAATTLMTTLMGGLLAAFFFGSSILSLGSIVGFFTILGISVRNKILLINHYQHLEEEEGEPFGEELVKRGTRERLAPILMTALATALALVPLVIAGNIPGHEIEHPMAIVILGGLVTSALTNLFVVPSLYLRFAKSDRELRTTQEA
ncbi:MAG: AcrB/AcrD/AcrF family protein [Anaerolineales bacterium]|nr:AcrB/AcrD/AcrF family protein [Anaerolineales bacterium]